MHQVGKSSDNSAVKVVSPSSNSSGNVGGARKGHKRTRSLHAGIPNTSHSQSSAINVSNVVDTVDTKSLKERSTEIAVSKASKSSECKSEQIGAKIDNVSEKTAKSDLDRKRFQRDRLIHQQTQLAALIYRAKRNGHEPSEKIAKQFRLFAAAREKLEREIGALDTTSASASAGN